uniref:GIY-YIG domain-containing protein n=1 Tax=Trichobilharzia regenti TaxID=157069 RepID=A0AA85IV02_TRIRE|nr:unnamed protein product [Trichobilharzia regenti]
MGIHHDSNITTVPKKTLFMNLEFKGDIAAEILRNRLSKSLKKTFPTATLRITFSFRQLIQSNVKEKIPLLATSTCIYQFTSSCGTKYIGRTQRQVHKRVLEHCPAWLARGEKKNSNSSILEHLVISGHRAPPHECFTVVHRVPQYRTKGLRMRHLYIAEVLAIRDLKSDLCIQKRYIHSLALPWSE